MVRPFCLGFILSASCRVCVCLALLCFSSDWFTKYKVYSIQYTVFGISIWSWN